MKYANRYIHRFLVLFGAAAFVFSSATCSVATFLPKSVGLTGGFYVPWNARHTAERAAVLKCVGLSAEGAPPSLWVIPASLTDETGHAILAYYDHDVHAIVFTRETTTAEFWRVFRHEVIHAARPLEGHGARFRLAERCDFWPADSSQRDR